MSELLLLPPFTGGHWKAEGGSDAPHLSMGSSCWEAAAKDTAEEKERPGRLPPKSEPQAPWV